MVTSSPTTGRIHTDHIGEAPQDMTSPRLNVQIRVPTIFGHARQTGNNMDTSATRISTLNSPGIATSSIARRISASTPACWLSSRRKKIISCPVRLIMSTITTSGWDALDKGITTLGFVLETMPAMVRK
ncbi:uncharacterized protein LOC121416534 [Lytechinus variegatus]|uniref:uncharacterized protein LOC121416534 n=1 Tax=Lytechinus variegatus TaxID=7654 RepID=UPI001BB20DA0|nr:uncharacterized protein LOC121416534 [Lytechinus variegatus]